MNGREYLTEAIMERFEKMSNDDKKEFIKLIEEMAEEEEKEEGTDNPAIYTVRDRLIDDIDAYGEEGIDNFELASFLVSMAHVTTEVAIELLNRRNGGKDLKLDDLRKVLTFKDELAQKVLLEISLFIVFMLDMDFNKDTIGDSRWCFPDRLSAMFDLSKLILHAGDDFLINEELFKDFKPSSI